MLKLVCAPDDAIHYREGCEFLCASDEMTTDLS